MDGRPSDPADFDAPLEDKEARGEQVGPSPGESAVAAAAASLEASASDVGGSGTGTGAGGDAGRSKSKVLQSASLALALANHDPDALRIRAGLAALEHHPGGKAGVITKNSDVASPMNPYLQFGMADDDTGHARIVFADGAVYAGEMRGGRIEGRGRYESPQGVVTEGVFLNGMLEGKGTHISQHGVVSEGAWRLGMLHGRAIRTGGGMYGDMFAGRFERG